MIVVYVRKENSDFLTVSYFIHFDLLQNNKIFASIQKEDINKNKYYKKNYLKIIEQEKE